MTMISKFDSWEKEGFLAVVTPRGESSFFFIFSEGGGAFTLGKISYA